MRKFILSFMLIFSCSSCVKHDGENIESIIVDAVGVVYVYDNSEQCHDIAIHLTRTDALVLWKIITNGSIVEDQNDQGLAYFNFNLSNKKSLEVEIGQSGILRYKSKAVKIDLSDFEKLIEKYFEGILIDGEKPDIHSFP